MAKLYLQDGNSTSSTVLGDSDPTPSGYTESNTIEDWDYYGVENIGTYPHLKTNLSLRAILKTLIDEKGFDNCTVSEKEIACNWLIATKAQRDTICTEEEQWNHKENLLLRIRQDNSELCVFSDNSELVQITSDGSGNLTGVLI